MAVNRWHCDQAWIGGVARNVVIEEENGRIVRVTPDAPVEPDAMPLAGLTVPGLANTHSHAFHRALRGSAQQGAATFWSWRDEMYRLADRLDPESYFRLARAVYGEMVLAGITAVGEFHYLHHQAGGTPYADPNEDRRSCAPAERSRAPVAYRGPGRTHIGRLERARLVGGTSERARP